MFNTQLQLHLLGDAVLTPQRILPRDALYERNVLRGNSWTTRLPTGTPPPKQPIALTMPTNDRVRLDDDKRVSPLRPATGEPNAESTVFTAEAWRAPSPLENLQLVTQRCDFQEQAASVGNREPQRGQECEQIREYFAVLLAAKVSAHDRLRNSRMK